MENQNNQKRGPGGDAGEIFIAARKIRGDGKITADGGDGSVGGKGGRITLISEDNQFKGELSVKGGKSDAVSSAIKREKWSSERVPSGYPASCNSDQIREVIQDLSEEKYNKLQRGKHNVIWEKIIDDLIKNGQAELAQKRETRRGQESENLFPHSAPKFVTQSVWVRKVLDRYVGGKIKNNFLRGVLYSLIVLLLLFLILRFGLVWARDTGSFQYQPQSIAYGSRSASEPATIDVLFQGDIRNISSSPRYLRNFVGVLWKNESLGSTWDYLYSTDAEDIYLVQGATNTLATLPLRFEPNETRTLQWRFHADLKDDPEVMNFLAQQTCKGVFCWNKNQFSILTVDSRGNIFDQRGDLESQSVIDAWWVFPNNKTLWSQFIASLDLFLKIATWKVRSVLVWYN